MGDLLEGNIIQHEKKEGVVRSVIKAKDFVSILVDWQDGSPIQKSTQNAKWPMHRKITAQKPAKKKAAKKPAAKKKVKKKTKKKAAKKKKG